MILQKSVLCLLLFDLRLSVYALLFIYLISDRPLWVEYPKDAATFTMDDQFLIGKS